MGDGGKIFLILFFCINLFFISSSEASKVGNAPNSRAQPVVAPLTGQRYCKTTCPRDPVHAPRKSNPKKGCIPGERGCRGPPAP